MAVLYQTLLGLFIGILSFHARFDSLWYQHFGSDLNTLKSKVITSQRAEATSMLNSPPNYNYVMGVCAFLLVLSSLGQVFQHAKQRIGNMISFLLLLSCTAIRYLALKPIAKVFKARYIKPDEEARALYSISLWNTISLTLLICCVLIKLSLEEEEEEVSKKKKTA